MRYTIAIAFIMVLLSFSILPMQECVEQPALQIGALQEDFFEAVRMDDYIKAALCFERGANINALDGFGDTALLAATRSGKVTMVVILLSKGADFHVKDTSGYTPLLWAVLNNHKSIVTLLLEKGASIDDKDALGNTPLLLAAELWHHEIVELLLNKGADSITQNIHALTPLQQTGQKNSLERSIRNLEPKLLSAAQAGDSKRIVYLLNLGVTLHVQDKEGKTALHLAAQNGHKEVVSLLIDRGANIHALDKNRLSVVYLALIKGHKDTIILLFNKGAIDMPIAAEIGYKTFVALLLDMGKDINVKGDRGSTALHKAVEKGHKEIVELLLNRGADVNAQDNYGETALHGASRKEIGALLLNKGASINVKNIHGDTPLYRAAEYGCKEMVAFLISAGADILARNNNGDIPLYKANKNGYKEIVQLLQLCSQQEVQEYLKNPLGYIRSNPLVITSKGQTLLMLACIFGHTESIALLRYCPGNYINIRDCYNRSALDYAAYFDLTSAVYLIHTFSKKFTLSPSEIDILMKQTIRKGNLILVNALLGIGAKPTLELAQQAREGGYLKIMHRLLFSYLADPNNKCHPKIVDLSGLFK